jgi:hypothetical protein
MGANMQHQWTDTLFRTRAAMLDAIAEAWITANGHASPAEVAATLAELTDAELAAEAIEGWGLATPADAMDAAMLGRPAEGPSHMEREGYSADDLAAAFARLRASASAPA